ncbi:hypothetical protein FGK63_06040 [Ruegeria sediminis]|uniref:Uncharacterized protein n=1 Tax=Ruegeria sediminis TaxID=2583820 RepID=A0ABY2X0B3_9RHOB|nr:hypothetical protein [Ruegeria sediminis]TMV08680.1 hypothetical protein FGK63_06040 [Ruegeria sediminis]
MNAQDTISRVRSIRTAMHYGMSIGLVQNQLFALERELAPTQKPDFEIGIEGFDTVLSYLSKTNPEALDLIHDPIHDTVKDGKTLAVRARCRGLPVLRVEAPAHIKTRYPTCPPAASIWRWWHSTNGTRERKQHEHAHPNHRPFGGQLGGHEPRPYSCPLEAQR